MVTYITERFGYYEFKLGGAQQEHEPPEAWNLYKYIQI
jgi:hypothetical protein